MVLEGLAIAELPGFIAVEFLKDRRLEAVLPDWRLPKGALYFVTSTTRTRPVKIDALASFVSKRLSNMDWS